MRNGIIIQARMGSTRLPGKVLKDFYKGDSILDLILKRLLTVYSSDQITVATTCLEEDDQIVNHLNQRYEINVFQGKNEDVLNRFIDAAEFYNLNSIVRICADNPFLDIESIGYIISILNNSFDYVGFQMPNGLPAIKSHLGLFTEGIKLKALKKVCEYTNDKVYHEHVTQFIYEHTDTFKIRYIGLPEYLLINSDSFRFTIDTIEDFELLQTIYQCLLRRPEKTTLNINTRELIEFTKSNLAVISEMERQISLNSK